MKKKYEFIAKTADEAIDKALAELNCSMSDIDIEVEEYQQKGFLGFFKPKEIKIIATFKDEYLKQIEQNNTSSLSLNKKETPTKKAKDLDSEPKKTSENTKKSEQITKTEIKPYAKQVQTKEEQQEQTTKEIEKNLVENQKENKEQKSDLETDHQTKTSQTEFSVYDKIISNVDKSMEELKNSKDGDFEDDFDAEEKYRKKSVDFNELTDEERSKIKDLAHEFIMDLLDAMKIDAEVSLIEKRQQLLVLVNIREGKQLIGYRGETLFAIQYLMSVYMNYKMDKYLRIKLDINNYRRKKETELKKRIFSVARKVEKTKKPIKLEEMHASDRHFIHMQLKKNKKVYTKSEGVEPNRCVVILPVEKSE